MNSSIRSSKLLASCLVAATLTPAAIHARERVPAPDTECRRVAEPDVLAARDLKSLYLRCSDAAMAGRLEWSEVAHCSLIYEELLRETFHGDFLALLAWSRSQPAQDLTLRARSVPCATL